MKKLFTNSFIILIVLITSVGCSQNSDISQPQTLKDYPKEVHQVITETILNDNKGKFTKGDYQAEGHIILDSEVKQEGTYFYTLISYGEYISEEGKPVRISGVSGIPAVIVLSEDAQGVKMSWVENPPSDVSVEEQITEMFPEAFHDRLLMVSPEDTITLNQQEIHQVEAAINALKS